MNKSEVIGVLIEEPAKMTRDEVESKAEDLDIGLLSHIYSSCDAPLAKSAFVVELAGDWSTSKDDLRRRCGYRLFYELSKNKRLEALDDQFLMKRLSRIEKTIRKEENLVKGAMLGALIGIGKRNVKLNRAAIKVVKSIGPIEVEYGNNRCEAPDVLEHLTSDNLKNRFKKQQRK